ncbi:hypothetical protein CANCADRAFT_56014 [Tortispora caseinolytica NRRL Y-17796]|uniref:Major facilitator superfamily (MFS) profile domain-containing protein n=1 Tax=Tortispora caseinolytica NRRL Y-17796 TaxID=767744 RepID=A0A1E4TKR9_9ASCO|nr:hypothetical protein CANCADRAFT_56014 [Tortispora caseinolytica NRRL Y-17796]
MTWNLGIRQLSDDVDVSGTIVMLTDNNDQPGSTGEQTPAPTDNLKRTKTGIILHPQPRDNPNDPLNWPRWQRDLALIVIGFHCFVGGGQTPILASGFTQLSNEFDVPKSTLAYLVGAFMLTLGLSCLIASPIAILWGKRMVYLLGILFFLAGALWGGASHSFGSLLGARIIMAVGVSPCESLPSSSIAEIYFHHERAYRLGIYTLLLLGGKNLVPLVSGFIINGLGWNWVFWILSIVVGFNFCLTFFCVPETFWLRDPVPNKRSQRETHLAHLASRARRLSRMSNASHDAEVSFAVSEPEAIPYKPYLKRLAVYSGRHSGESFLRLFIRPVLLYSYPAILYSTLCYSLAVVWLIVMSELLSQVFSAPPYNFSSDIVGLLYVSPFIGGVLGTAVIGKVSDMVVRKMTRMNGGVYEPEFRLVMILFVFLTITIGLMGFGWSSEEEDSWIVPTVFFGIISFGCSLASTTAVTYAVDSYRVFASESLVSLNLFKNILGFCFSLFTNDFATRAGYRTTFIVFGSIQIFISLLAIPLYMYGKHLRHWTDQRPRV